MESFLTGEEFTMTLKRNTEFFVRKHCRNIGNNYGQRYFNAIDNIFGATTRRNNKYFGQLASIMKLDPGVIELIFKIVEAVSEEIYINDIDLAGKQNSDLHGWFLRRSKRTRI